MIERRHGSNAAEAKPGITALDMTALWARISQLDAAWPPWPPALQHPRGIWRASEQELLRLDDEWALRRARAVNVPPA